MTTESLQILLKRIWGYDTFRPGQEEIVHHIAMGHHGIALLPTGGGKSICFQVPGLAREACTLVISPLISLMEDQVADLQRRGISALSLAGDIDNRAWDQVMDRAIAGEFSFLYLSPERALSARFIRRIPYLPLGLLAIDEAHCISQWGHDFRPSYTQLGRLREKTAHLPCLAVTASATPEVLQDIQTLLHLEGAQVFRKSFARPNLAIHVHHSPQRERSLLQWIKPDHGRQIIYTRSRSQTAHWAKRLGDQGIPSGAYHAGMSSADRSQQQKNWSEGVQSTMVATNAFGMGIDQANVRQVFHIDIPDSPEAYYQEIGRAGRDGASAEAHFFLDPRVEQSFRKRLNEEEIRWEDLSKLYNRLASLGQIAVGDGKDFRQTIDLEQLAEQMDRPRRWIHLALQTLEREGIFRLHDGWQNQSQVHMLLHGEALVRAAESIPTHAHVAYAIARKEPGVGQSSVPFSPKALASSLDLPIPALYAALNTLQHAGILRWEHVESKTQIIWSMAREAEGYMPIPRKKLERLMTAKGLRAEAMLDMLHGSQCRMRSLLAYFQEELTADCGRCDRCTEIRERGPLAIQAHILTMLKQAPASAASLTKALPDKEALVAQALRDGIERHLWERTSQGIYQLT